MKFMPSSCSRVVKNKTHTKGGNTGKMARSKRCKLMPQCISLEREKTALLARISSAGSRNSKPAILREARRLGKLTGMQGQHGCLCRAESGAGLPGARSAGSTRLASSPAASAVETTARSPRSAARLAIRFANWQKSERQIIPMAMPRATSSCVGLLGPA